MEAQRGHYGQHKIEFMVYTSVSPYCHFFINSFTQNLLKIFDILVLVVKNDVFREVVALFIYGLMSNKRCYMMYYLELAEELATAELFLLSPCVSQDIII